MKWKKGYKTEVSKNKSANNKYSKLIQFKLTHSLKVFKNEVKFL